MRPIYSFATTLILAFMIIGGPAMAKSSEKITWLYFNFPPVYVKSNDSVSGFGMDIIKLLQDEMPEYAHQNILASPGRMMAELAEGKHVIIVGMLKTPKRMETMAFTELPCRLASPSMIAMRKEDAKRLCPKESVSVETLLRDPTLTFADIENINYGSLQPIIAAHKDKARYVTTSEGIPHLVTMIMNKRADWTILDPLAVEYYNKQFGFNDRIAMVGIDEHPVSEFLTGYVIGPKTTWGIDTLQHIDTILRREIRSGKLYSILAPYVPPALGKEFKKAYDSQILAPALQ